MDYAVVEDVARQLYIFALKTIPPDVTAALQRAFESETSPQARGILGTILKNIDVAEETTNLVCQDTGVPIYKVRVGTASPIDGLQVRSAIIRGCERATREHPLRS